MADFTTITHGICSQDIKQEVEVDLVLNSNSEEAPSVTENTFACNKVEIDENESVLNLHLYSVKKDELADDSIKTDDYLKSFNTDLPLYIDERIPVSCDQEVSNLFECRGCLYKANSEITLKLHVQACLLQKQVDRDNIMKCGKCEYSTSKAKHLRQHVLRNHDESKLKHKSKLVEHTNTMCCDKCDYKTYSESMLIQHQVVHSDHKTFKCELCSFSSKREGSLKKHVKRHSAERNFNCDKCNYKGYNKYMLSDHKLVHSEERPFKCSLCDYSTKQSRYLKAHLKERNLSCDICDFKTEYKCQLAKHKSLHTEERSYKCLLCDFSTQRSKHFKLHVDKHSGERKLFRCDKCKYKTYYNFKLAKHVRIHSAETLYECSLCDFSARSANGLTVHLKKHLATL